MADLPLVVAGDSAGGNLAAIIAKRFRDKLNLAAQVLFYPVTDADFATSSYQEFGDSLNLRRRDMQWFFENYVAEAHLHSEDVSPLRAANLSDLAPCVMSLARHDVLFSEGQAYAQALKDAGVPTTLRIGEDLPHGFVRFHNLCKEASEALKGAADDLRTLLAQGPEAPL